MKYFLFFILTFVFACNSLVVFDGYTDNTCTTRLWGNFPRIFFPVTDRTQGVDYAVGDAFYNGNPPAIVGQFTNISATSVTLCNGAKCENWSVTTNNSVACDYTPCFGYGRFYNVPGPAVLMLARTSGSLSMWDPTTCSDPTPYGWVAYYGEISPDTAPCKTIGGTTQWYWNETKLTLFRPTSTPWSIAQPCGTSPYPGEKCFSSGMGYCTRNNDCNIDRPYVPNMFPFTGAAATTVKVVNANTVDVIITPNNAEILKTSFYIMFVCAMIIV